MYNYLVLIFWPRMYGERTNHFRIKIILYISTQGSHCKCCICQELFVLQSRVRQNAILKTEGSYLPTSISVVIVVMKSLPCEMVTC